jgi:hypothetical protein
VSTPEESQRIAGIKIAPLETIVERNQIWSRMAAKYGVENPLPPWKSSLDGICDALDRDTRGTEILGFIDRRADEDQLSATRYSNLPYPENQLVALAHSLVSRGIIDETQLQERLAIIRARLEA